MSERESVCARVSVLINVTCSQLYCVLVGINMDAFIKLLLRVYILTSKYVSLLQMSCVCVCVCVCMQCLYMCSFVCTQHVNVVLCLFALYFISPLLSHDYNSFYKNSFVDDDSCDDEDCREYQKQYLLDIILSNFFL